ncbi:UNVERIFIED_CONTAM: hypothetical protein HDU68_002882 [Siphonaria sp. JEL0065]|nr:hypothetical protein HDU68_002882 [Siphonaria sp. JEL0065]
MSLSHSPSPFSSPRDCRGLIVPVRREDSDVNEVVGVRVGGRSEACWTIADLKLGLKALTGLSLHEQVIMFSDHQLTDGIKISKEDLGVVLDNGGFFLRRRDQKCGTKRLFSKGIRSLSTFITRNFTNPAILQQQQERMQQQQQQLDQQPPADSPPQPPLSSGQMVDDNDSATSSVLDGVSMDSSAYDIYDAFEYAILRNGGGDVLSGVTFGSCARSDMDTVVVAADDENDCELSPVGVKRTWPGDSDDLDEEFDSDNEEEDDATFGVNNVVEGSVFLDHASAKKIQELLFPNTLDSTVVKIATIEDDAVVSKSVPCSVLGSAAEASTIEPSPRKRVRAI